jgi:hypothetical protein
MTTSKIAPTLEETFADLYSDEINWSISTVWDTGYEIKLGDSRNGFHATKRVQGAEEIGPALRRMVAEHYPETDWPEEEPLLSLPKR